MMGEGEWQGHKQDKGHTHTCTRTHKAHTHTRMHKAHAYTHTYTHTHTKRIAMLVVQSMHCLPLCIFLFVL